MSRGSSFSATTSRSPCRTPCCTQDRHTFASIRARSALSARHNPPDDRRYVLTRQSRTNAIERRNHASLTDCAASSSIWNASRAPTCRYCLPLFLSDRSFFFYLQRARVLLYSTSLSFSPFRYIPWTNVFVSLFHLFIRPSLLGVIDVPVFDHTQTLVNNKTVPPTRTECSAKPRARFKCSNKKWQRPPTGRLESITLLSNYAPVCSFGNLSILLSERLVLPVAAATANGASPGAVASRFLRLAHFPHSPLISELDKSARKHSITSITGFRHSDRTFSCGTRLR